MMMARLMFVVIRPAFAVLLALGATLGVAASNIIMNLLVGYFAVATSAFTSVHPHIALHGKWTAEEARRQASLAKSLDRRIEAATPALHFERTITLATVKVITDLCEGGGTAEESCRQNRFLKNPTRTYAYEVTNQRRVEVQIRGITVDGGETTADIRKLMSGEPDLGRLAADKDSGGNELPIAFIAEDSLINDPTGSFLLAPHELAPTYPHYYRLHGLLRLGAMTSGSPMILLGLDQSRALAPSSLPPANVIEVRVSDVLEAERVADVLKGASAGQWTGGPDVGRQGAAGISVPQCYMGNGVRGDAEHLHRRRDLHLFDANAVGAAQPVEGGAVGRHWATAFAHRDAFRRLCSGDCDDRNRRRDAARTSCQLGDRRHPLRQCAERALRAICTDGHTAAGIVDGARDDRDLSAFGSPAGLASGHDPPSGSAARSGMTSRA